MANDTTITLRPATNEDRTYLSRLHYLADVFGDESRDLPESEAADHHKYVNQWDPHTQGGIIAISSHAVPAGGLFLRYWKSNNPGSGWVGYPEVPELVIAVERRYAGLGLGTRLLEAGVELARTQGAPGISLFVDENNPRARARYEKFGFEYKTGSTMVKWFEQPRV
mgnify:FL=1